MRRLGLAAAGFVVLMVLVACGGTSGSKETWVVTELAPTRSFDSAAEAINDRGQIVGWSGDWDHSRAFLWEGGKITELGSLPGRKYSFAEDINERGQIVGTSWNNSSYASSGRAFLWDNGRMTDLGTLGGPTSFASAINDRGQIVGTTYTKRGDMRAFLWENGRMRDLGTLGGPDSEATDINERGQVVGSSLTSPRTDDTWDSTRPFRWQRGKMLNLDGSGEEEGHIAYAIAINNPGAILVAYKWSEGNATEVTGVRRSVWLGGLDANDISDRGLIVGTRKERPAFRMKGWLTARILPSLTGTPQPGEANGVNNQGQIVGSSGGHAVLWTLRR